MGIAIGVNGSRGGLPGRGQPKFRPERVAVAGVPLNQPQNDEMREARREGGAAGTGGGQKRGLPARDTFGEEREDLQ